MRHLVVASLTATSLGLGLSAVASAADLGPAPAPAPVYTKAPAAVPFSWTGFYIGGNAGWVESTGNNITDTGTDTGASGLGSALAAGGIPSTINLPYNGFIGGGQAGYNWQAGMWLFGIEADFDAVSAKASFNSGPITAPGFVPITTSASRELEWLSTVRGRLGVTSGPFLAYVTGGAAFGERQLGIGAVAPAGVPPLDAFTTTTNTAAGWTVGGGAEWMFAPHWSVKAEYLYVDLSDISSTIPYAYGGNTSTLTGTAHDRENIARGGINYHF
jgi:outer membrane immunogenic protein